LVTPEKIVCVVGLMGLLLAAAGIAAGWRWPLTAAACAFLVEYALAFLVVEAPSNSVAAAGFGLGTFLLLQAADLALRTRRAAVGRGVIWSHLGRLVGLGGGILVAALLAVAGAQGLAGFLPFAAAPFLAAAGALGVMIGLAIVVARAARRASPWAIGRASPRRGSPPGGLAADGRSG